MEVSFLSQCVQYYPLSGTFTWRERPRWHFKTDRAHKTFNTQFAFLDALNVLSDNGYLRGEINGSTVYAHRAAFALAYGHWPVDQIDHLDRDRQNNRIANLIESDTQRNCMNQSLPTNNVSGHIGVRFHKASQKWLAQIRHQGEQFHIGTFDTKDEAIMARLAVQNKLGFPESHGS